MGNVGSKNQKIAIITLSLTMSLCLVVATAGLIVFPMMKKLYAKKGSLEEKNNFSQNIKADLLRERDYDAFRKNMDDQKTIIDSAMIDKELVVSLIEKIEKIAHESGNEISINQYQPPKKKKKTADEMAVDSQNTPQEADTNKKMNFLQIDLFGDYGNFLHFLHKLENMDYALRVDYLQTKVREKKIMNLEETAKNGSLESKIIIGFDIAK